MNRIAIIGAGAAGLTAAWHLRTSSAEVKLFEKSRGYTGRAATRSHGAVRYDFGANYLAGVSGRVRTLITETLPTDRLATIERPVWTFNGAGVISPPDEGAGPRWTYDGGVNTLGKLMVQEGALGVVRTTRIRHLEAVAGGWQLHSTEGEVHGPFDAVLCTAPAPQAATIMQRSQATGDAKRDLQACAKALNEAAYAPQFAYVLGCEAPIDRPEAFYGLRSASGDHPVAWISFEEDKPGRVPAGQSVLVVQMSASWTAPRVDTDPAVHIEAVQEQVAGVLGTALPPIGWTDAHRWRYAFPTTPPDAALLDDTAASGLYFAGDYRIGAGRVGRAMESGWAQAERIEARHIAPVAS